MRNELGLTRLTCCKKFINLCVRSILSQLDQLSPGEETKPNIYFYGHYFKG